MSQMFAIRQVATSPLFLANLATFLLSVALFLFARHYRESYSSRWFAAWLIVNTAWIGTHTTGLIATDPQLRLVLDSLELAMIVGAAGCWLLFTLAYSGWWNGERARIPFAVAVLTSTVVLVLVSNPIHHLVLGQATYGFEYGVVVKMGEQTRYSILLLLAYVFALYIAGMIVLLNLVGTTSRLYRDQIAALLGAVLVPLTVATLVLRGGVLPSVDLTPLSFGLSALPLTYAVFRSEVLGFVPASYRVGERTALETLDQGVLVRDADDRVVFVNPSAESILGDESEQLLGRTVEDVLQQSRLDPVHRWIGDDASQRTDGGQSRVASEEGIPGALHDDRTGRIFRTFGTTDGESGGSDPGGTLFLKDVTDERRRKERLLVLNRIVRHNLRNDMTVLRGHTELLSERIEDESVDVVSDIAADLQHLGEKTHEMDRIMRQMEATVDPVDVSSIVDQVARRVEAESDATVEVWGDVQAWTRTDSVLIEGIVSNLVEIAVNRSGAGNSSGEHATADEGEDDAPTVVVTITAEDRAVHVSVEDDGPGIPEAEVRALLDGELSALQDGASIGLWVVKWCVDLADAEWDIETGEWTRVTVTFRSEPDMQTAPTGIGPSER